MNAHAGAFDPKHVRRRFDRAATCFDDADFVHQQTFSALLERLSPVVVSPLIVLDLGAGTGRRSHALAKHFRKSSIVSLDISGHMLHVAKKEKRLFAKRAELQGDATQIPLQTGSVDLVFANLLLPWIDDLSACFAEVARVLRKGGVFAFATLGPDSLIELRRAWSDVDTDHHVAAFPDMHDVGDTLLKHGLSDPVLDVDYLTVTYKNTAALYRDLTRCGARNCLVERRRTLTGKNRFRRMEEGLRTGAADGAIALTLELVFGHAWGTGPRPKEGEFHLDANLITRRDRR